MFHHIFSMWDLSHNKKANRGQQKPLKLIFPDRDLTDLEILQYAFLFFNNFKSLMVNNIFSFDLRDESKALFNSSLGQNEDKEALMIIEDELDFIYEGLYTKGAVLHSGVGAVSRLVSLGSLLSAFIIFHYRHNKIQEFHKTDIVITYTLFLVGIVLDVISILMFLFSDWTTATLAKLKEDPDEKDSTKDRILNYLLYQKRPKWKMQTYREGHQQEVLDTSFLLRKWTGAIKMFNFITYSINADTEKIHNPRDRMCWHLWKTTVCPFSYAISIIHTWSGNIAIRFCHLRQNVIRHLILLPPGENLVTRSIVNIFKTFVRFLFDLPYIIKFLVTCLVNFLGIKNLFHEMRLLSSVHSEPLTRNLWSFIFSELQMKSQIVYTKTSSSARKGWASSDTLIQIADHEMLLRYVTDVDYDHSLLIWHIATELCYQEEEASTKENQNNRELSKIISDYMMYLLIMQPKLMSEVAGIGKIRFRDTLAEAERFYKKMGISNSRNVRLASENILSVDTSIEPRDVKGNDSKSVLFEASSLAKELETEYGEDKWETLSKMWLEFLFHAATHCDGATRMELLSKGGEFINFVWLLMAHLGLGSD